MEHAESLETGSTPLPGEAETAKTVEAVGAADTAPTASAAQPLPAPEVPPAHPTNEIILPAETTQVRLVLQVPEDTCLEVEIEARTAGGRLLGQHALVFGGAQAGTAAFERTRFRARALSLPVTLFWLALGVYTITRLWALPSYPIFFFTDEAIQTVTAADLLRDHFVSATHEFLPTYFQNGSQYNLSASVYLQILPYFFLGKSIWVTRGVSALMTLIAAGSVGLILKRVFKSSYPWLAVMFLSITPAWFLHSRTAFETVLAASFYAGFLYFYLLYRTEKPRYIYPAVALGALAFYSYSGMKMVILVTCLLLLFSDLKYHWQNRGILMGGLALAGLLAAPFVRFLINHPDAGDWQMRLLGSYWILDIPLMEKLGDFVLEYLRGLDPLYWYLPNSVDLLRHVMLGYGHVLRLTLPLAFLGMALALSRVRQPAYRILLIAVLAAPSGAALVRVGITRVLVLVIPLAILTALGAQTLMDWILRRWQKITRPALSLAVFALLAGGNVYMLYDALVNGPFWNHDYGLTGQQYGAQQVFGEIDRYLKEQPDTHIILSPSWANGTDVIARFFFPDPLPFELGSIVGYFDEIKPLDDKTLFIMIPEEFDRIPPTRFTDVTIEKVLVYPDGRPGFYFVRLKYVPNIAEVISQEETSRRELKTGLVTIGSQMVGVGYSALDMGEIGDLFDGNPDTLARSWAINPMQLHFDFPAPRSMKSLIFRIGGTATTITIQAWRVGEGAPVEVTLNLPEEPRPRDARYDFESPLNVTRLWVDIKNTNDPPDGHVHLWEVTFK